MKSKELKAVAIGAGWAGEGHTKALQHYGGDVVAICARKADVVQKVASRLGVSEASTDQISYPKSVTISKTNGQPWPEILSPILRTSHTNLI